MKSIIVALIISLLHFALDFQNLPKWNILQI
jgi:hypothetical protein